MQMSPLGCLYVDLHRDIYRLRINLPETEKRINIIQIAHADKRDERENIFVDQKSHVANCLQVSDTLFED